MPKSPSKGLGAVREAGAGALAGVPVDDRGGRGRCPPRGPGEGDSAPLGPRSQVDGGRGHGATSEDLAEIKDLKARVRRLEEDNEVLRRVSIFFAGELDIRNRQSSRSSTRCGPRATRSS